MIFIDYPRFYPLSDYKTAITKMVDELRKIEGIVAIYQLGSIGQPGISDIDMLAIFRDSVIFQNDPRATLNKKDKYLFSHGLYGLSEAHVPGVKKFSFYYHPNYLWGNDLFDQGVTKLEKDELVVLKTQIALEFLLKMYINMVIEQKYQIIKIRALLLQAKALLLDLDLLDIQDCLIRTLLNRIVHWRESWFELMPEKVEIVSWLCEFQKEFPLFLDDLLVQHSFYLQGKGKMRMGNNIEINYSNKILVSHKGITFPWLGFLGRRYFNLLHRFNHFAVDVSFKKEEIPKIIVEKHIYFTSTKKWLAGHGKYFMPLASSLNVNTYF